MRTVSPYFSSKKASAPRSIASSIGRNSTRDRPIVTDDRADLVLDRPLLVVGEGAIERVVEAQVVGMDERAGLARRVPDDVPQRPVQEVRAGVVAHRVGAPIGIDHGLDGLADLQPAAQRPAMDDQPTDRALRVLDREQLAAATGSRMMPWSPTWPPPSA